VSETSSSGGKVLALNEEARNALASRREAQVSEATRAQIAAQLGPLVRQIEDLSQQIDMIPVHLRTGLQETTDQVSGLRTDLEALPEALAVRLAPALDLTERLDEVLRVQRSTLEELAESLTEKTDERVRTMVEQLRSETAEITKLASQSRGALAQLQQLPERITKRQKAVATKAEEDLKKAQGLLDAALDGIETDERRRLEAIEEAAQRLSKPWFTVVTAAVVSATAVAAVIGGLAWLGILDLSALRPPVDANAKARAVLEQMHREAAGRPDIQQWIEEKSRGLE